MPLSIPKLGLWRDVLIHAIFAGAILLGPSAPTAHGQLLPVRINASGTLETLVPDTAEQDSRNFDPGTALICRWRTPDIDSVQWTLKDRGIIYTRAYRRCWANGAQASSRDIVNTADGRYVLVDTENNGLRLTDPRGQTQSVPSPSEYNDGLALESRHAFSINGKPGFFVLYTYHQKSILSSLLDRWNSEIFWFPDPENLQMGERLFSRPSEGVQDLSILSETDVRLADRLRQTEMLAEAPTDLGVPPDKEGTATERQLLVDKWPWLGYADQIRKTVLESGIGTETANEEGQGTEESAIYLLLRSNRFVRLVPGRDEVSVFQEMAPTVFREKVLDFRVLNDRTLLILFPTGIYLYDLTSGEPTLRARFSQSSVKSVYPALALTPDHRYAGVMVWTRAHRNEIYTIALQGPRNMRRIVRGEMDMRYVPGIDQAARFNPNAFNFSPDGLALVTLWNVKDGQEVRIYRLYDGDLAPLPPEKEEEEGSEVESAEVPTDQAR